MQIVVAAVHDYTDDTEEDDTPAVEKEKEEGDENSDMVPYFIDKSGDKTTALLTPPADDQDEAMKVDGQEHKVSFKENKCVI